MALVEFSDKVHVLDVHEEEKIIEAVTWINTKVEETTMRGLEEIGEYILEKFFNNDPDEARSYHPRKNRSFTRLAKHHDLIVHRTTLQNAVGIALLKRNNELSGLSSLKRSHLIALLPLHKKDPGTFLALAQKADEERWTVKRTRNEVLRLKKKRIPNEKKLERDVKSIKRKIDRMVEETIETNMHSRTQLLDELEGCIAFLQKRIERLSEPVLRHTGSLN